MNTKATEKIDLTEFHWMTVLLQNIDVGIVVLDRDYRIQVWNTFMENHSGIQPQNVRNGNLFELFPQISEKWFRRKCDAVFLLQTPVFSTWRQRPYLFQFKNYRPITSCETNMYQNFTIFPITAMTGETENIALIIYDVTDIAISKKALEEKNKSLTLKNQLDPLTQLYNRGYWESRLQQEFARFNRYGNVSSLVMLDIDNFKKINDNHGHLAGDEVIRYLAKCINKLKRTTDIAGRYGGEEFGILLTDTNAEDALIFANRIRRLIEASHIMFEDIRIEITISLGISEFNKTAGHHEKIIAEADEALYKSKHNGRNQASIYHKTPPAQAVN